MKRALVGFLFAAGLLSAQAKIVGGGAKLTGVDQASYPKLLAAHKGRVVLVDVWATFCVPCRVEMPKLAKLSDKLRARGFDLVTISADEPEKEAAAFKVLMENSVAAPFFIKKNADDDKFNELIDPKWTGALPAMFLYDRTGKRVRSFVGETPISDVESAIEKALK